MGEKYSILRYKEFDNKLEKMEEEFKRQFKNIEKQLKENPYVGKPLGLRLIREKKIGGKRIYYRIKEKSKIVYLLEISGKKDQQQIIEKIKRFYTTLITSPFATP